MQPTVSNTADLLPLILAAGVALFGLWVMLRRAPFFLKILVVAGILVAVFPNDKLVVAAWNLIVPLVGPLFVLWILRLVLQGIAGGSDRQRYSEWRRER